MKQSQLQIVGLLTIGLLLIGANSCSKKGDTKTITYTISKAVRDSTPVLKVVMEFPADTSGTSVLLYDNEAWGERNLFNCIPQISLQDTEGTLLKESDSGRVIIHHPKSLKKLKIQYSLQQDFREKGARGESYRPIVQEDYFHVFSHNFFMIPKHLGKEGEDLLNIVLNWEGFPEGYTIHNSFGSKKKRQYLPATPLSKFHNAIFLGGDFRLHHIQIEGNDIFLASRGDWIPFNDSSVLQVLEKTIKVQRDFWRDHSQNYFTVTMRPTPQEHGSSFQGTGLTNSFATSISNNEHTELEQLVYLFNHELQHNWIGHTIENENEEEQYWFSEGFTDYYTLKNIAKHNIQGLDKSYFVKTFNQKIRNLYSSPVKEAPNSEITYENFWSNRDYSKLPYDRGTLFAFYLDQVLYRESNGAYSLDNVMHRLQEAATETGEKVSHKHFISVVNEFLEEDVSPFFERHIEEGKLLDLEAFFDDLRLEYDSQTQVFDLGFEFNEDQTAVERIDPKSEAYKAGLRKGDKLVSRSIYYGSTTKPVELVVLRNGKEKSIHYLAVRIASIPQLKNTERTKARIYL